MSESDNFDSARAIQFIAPNHHEFKLKLDDLRQIFEVNIRDHHVVVVSIAGALRNGKSFLINFFLKYLYAQYKKHDLTDWIGEKSTSELRGFNWRGGTERETVGIWMWSEIFTYNFDNGDNVAIILMDTQGIFDNESSVKDCVSIFAISMLLSSVQCCNTMRGVREDDLQHLELFTNYARLTLTKFTEKPFQKLLFIIRDWPFAYDHSYGYSKGYIEDVLKENDKQTTDMRTLRAKIKSSFNDIEAFLMPHPGKSVAQEKDYSGDATKIEPEFLDCVKDLVPSIVSPQKLIVKRINGEKIRASDFVVYLKAYVEAFNGNEMPAPQSIVEANANGQIRILHENCSTQYVNIMENAFHDPEIYFTEEELNQNHQYANSSSLSMFRKAKKLGNQSLVSEWEEKLVATNRERFSQFREKNDVRKMIFSSIWKTIWKIICRATVAFFTGVVTPKEFLATFTFICVSVSILIAMFPLTSVSFVYQAAAYVSVSAITIIATIGKRLFA